MTRVVDGYFLLLKVLIALFLAIMVVLVFGNVVLRYAFNSGITVSEEVSRWLFVWLTFLGAMSPCASTAHLGVDTLVKRLPPMGKKVCLVVSQLLMLYATWLFLVGSWEQTVINWDVAAPASGLSTGLFYGVGVVFSVSVGRDPPRRPLPRRHRPALRRGARHGEGIRGAGGARGRSSASSPSATAASASSAPPRRSSRGRRR